MINVVLSLSKEPTPAAVSAEKVSKLKKEVKTAYVRKNVIGDANDKKHIVLMIV